MPDDSNPPINVNDPSNQVLAIALYGHLSRIYVQSYTGLLSMFLALVGFIYLVLIPKALKEVELFSIQVSPSYVYMVIVTALWFLCLYYFLRIMAYHAVISKLDSQFKFSDGTSLRILDKKLFSNAGRLAALFDLINRRKLAEVGGLVILFLVLLFSLVYSFA